jgi:hypothetical protein
VELQIWDVGSPGWTLLGVRGLNALALAKIDRKGRRWSIDTLILMSEEDESIEASTLRAIPIGRFEAMLNQHDMGARLAAEPMPLPPNLAKWTRTWRDELALVDEGLTRFRAGASRPSFSPDEAAPARDPLQRPDGSDPEAFYRKVAESYAAIVRDSSKPAKVLADEAGVPVATVHRWIHEARRRGFLPPATKGRAG